MESLAHGRNTRLSTMKTKKDTDKAEGEENWGIRGNMEATWLHAGP